MEVSQGTVMVTFSTTDKRQSFEGLASSKDVVSRFGGKRRLKGCCSRRLRQSQLIVDKAQGENNARLVFGSNCICYPFKRVSGQPYLPHPRQAMGPVEPPYILNLRIDGQADYRLTQPSQGISIARQPGLPSQADELMRHGVDGDLRRQARRDLESEQSL